MSRIPRLDSDATSGLKETIKQVESSMGYIPNDLLTLAHWPDMVPALGNLVSVVLDGGTVDRRLKRLIGIVASGTQGCQYCKAHASYAASKLDVSTDKIAHVFEFETSPLFAAQERIALRLAWHGSLQPNAISDADMAEARQHFSDSEIIEITSVISLYGFLNRCNSILATELEPGPASFFESLNSN